jgi:hypothetical protein
VIPAHVGPLARYALGLALRRSAAPGRRNRIGFERCAIGQHPPDRALEGAGTHADLTLAIAPDLLHDRVAVPVSTGQGQQDVQHRRSQQPIRFHVL